MKYIRFMIFCLLSLSASCRYDILNNPEHKLIKNFSSRARKEAGLISWSYGINQSLLRDYPSNALVGDFKVIYALRKTQENVVSVDEARCLIISVVESFLRDINTNQKIRKKLAAFPFPSNRMSIYIVFVDENDIGLGNGGVQKVYVANDKIRYLRYEIYEYIKPVPFGKHFVFHEEVYSKAFDIVKEQGRLREL